MPAPTLFHATTVAFQGRGLMITGASGSGKSALGLELMAIGAELVADDQTLVSLEGGALVARCPAPLHGLIEARGIGLLRVNSASMAQLVAVVDLDLIEEQRLPRDRVVTLLGQELALVLRVPASHFPSALMHYVLGGRYA